LTGIDITTFFAVVPRRGLSRLFSRPLVLVDDDIFVRLAK
jgi:hypothetical protein